MNDNGAPTPRQGLYDPAFEHDACGFACVVDVHGDRSYDIIQRALRALWKLTHRGATGADPSTGDGAGILLQIPDDYFRSVTRGAGFSLPRPGAYAVGMGFFSTDTDEQNAQMDAVQWAVSRLGHKLLGWRNVPIDPSVAGRLALRSMPAIRQVFVAARPGTPQDVFERQLYLTRRKARQRWRSRYPRAASPFRFASFSSRTIVYKGLLLPDQIARFYLDLDDRRVQTAIAIVHQRYSTNTFPAWHLAQPFRYLAHNGEINTLRGNAAWMRARQANLASPLFGHDIRDLLPILTDGTSDSAQLDNAVELLVTGGRSIAHALTMLMPEAWENDPQISDDLRAFYEFHSLLTEPWDGPAALAFTDGVRAGAMLDRNGLRPARYSLTKDGVLVIASETGTLDTTASEVVEAGRLGPGRMILADTEQGRLLHDDEIKESLAAARPWRQWVDQNRIRLQDLPRANVVRHESPQRLRRLQRLFGYSLEVLRIILPPMASRAQEAVGSMGDDTALACLSDQPRLLYDYFKQQFAQVTNPPIDPIRERMVMSLATTLGRDGSFLQESPDAVRELRLDRPILTDEELQRIKLTRTREIQAHTVPITYPVHSGGRGMLIALERACRDAEQAVADAATVLVLSDRLVDHDHAPIPALLATSALHQHLVQRGLRTSCGLVVETGEAWEVAHFALLIGYGAGAVNPYIAFQSVAQIAREASYTPASLTPDKAKDNYVEAIDNGLLKVFSKMGICTLQAYRGAGLFEAIGLARDLVDRFFPGTPSRIDGIDIDVIAEESAMRHRAAFAARDDDPLPPGGMYQWRRDGEKHAFHPDVIASLQHAVRQGSFQTFTEFSAAANRDARRACTLRGLLRFRSPRAPVPLDEVEPASAIVQRFCTGAMSFGSISKEAHETLAVAMNRIGGRSNTGEGGEDPARFHPDPDGTSRRSAIKQVASGRFGVTSHYLVNADELQIKIAQGAKPGEGGQLPGHKVDATIARIRHSTVGVGLISPPPHHDIYSIEDIAQLIHDLECANDRAAISVKLVSQSGIGTVAAGVVKGGAEAVVVAGHDGGTGASPLTSIKHTGIPWEIGLAEVQQTLVLNDLRGSVRVQVDGGLKTGRDVVVGAMLGADEFGFASAPLVALGCVMMRVCHLNTCPVGIATQDPVLRKRFAGAPDHVVRYFFFVAEEVRHIMSQLGFRRFDDIIGRTDLLEPDTEIGHWKARKLDFSELLYRPKVPHASRWRGRVAREPLSNVEWRILTACGPALDRREPVSVRLQLTNVDRSVGTRLGAEVSRRYGAEGLADGTIRLLCTGTAGQSLGAFLPAGITIDLEGDTNDYVAKGLSGGRVVVRTPRAATFDAADNVLVGNVCLYGATSGEAFFNGTAGERFAVRNAGATAVVEGVGDHGCEYMTGGVVVVLGPTGRNFAAGMSGGVAYVLDDEGGFESVCNHEMVLVEPLPQDDEPGLLALIRRHHELTGSSRAAAILENWDTSRARFRRVMPLDYKRILEVRAIAGNDNG